MDKHPKFLLIKSNFYFCSIGTHFRYAEQPLQDMELHEKEEEKDKSIFMKTIQIELKDKRCLILDSKLFKSTVKGKHSAGKEFQSLHL